MLDWWDDNGTYRGDLDFDIMTVRYPLTKKSSDLGVKVYYRGGILDLPVKVYTTLKSVTTDPADVIEKFWPNPDWDNDVDNGDGGPLELSRRVKVTATYASPDGNDQETYDLIYWHDVDKKKQLVKDDFLSDSVWDWYPYKAGPYYLFASDADIYEDPDDIGDDPDRWGDNYTESTYLKGYKKYLDNVNKKKYETNTKVTFLHEMSSDTITYFYAWLFANRWYNDGYWSDAEGRVVYWREVLDSSGSPQWQILPNSLYIYDTTDSKQPQAFGPKAEQKKKNKVTVNWVDQSVIR